MTTFESKADVCSLLQNISIDFVGDSLVRQIYISFLSKLQHQSLNKAETSNTSISHRKRCQEQLIYQGSYQYYIVRSVTDCNQTVNLRFHNHHKLTKPGEEEINRTITGLVGKQYSILYIGLGLHEDLNFEFVHERVVKPMVKIVGKNQWPKIIWATPHSPGPLKTPTFTKQQKDSVIAFNKKMHKVLKGYNIPVLDTFPLTTDIISYDGVHYGKRINDIKAQVLLNLIQRLRNSGWSSV
ncbi:uncharacterized protein LOC106011803 [Aplysia californica]|uniref:Uncharacterized protein LOC106011803 n=1 Tax=Aplysia californica TaxID=6500 RepID=A0ABM1VTL2_APLCA|nr:uncharacterized protein LOC106011803 [Aplysia californica]